MIFNSIDFAAFLPIVFALYWALSKKSLKLQNALIVSASYFFYAWWDWRFLSLILISTTIDYTIGILLIKQKNKAKRKRLLWLSIIINIGLLSFFKYYNFFIENFSAAFSFFGTEIKGDFLYIILPIGISFYTFQTLSYTIDIYRNKLKPTNDFIAFSAFVSFFPQLVAGPIERATNLLPQFYQKREFNYTKIIDGLRQILWGLFKKIVIADNCAKYANLIFDNSGDYSGSTLVLGAFFFTFQIYADFSGYSDIAIGTSRLFGFNLKQNFAFPYFSRDVAEFWRRWHISLTTWFRDYIYIPLGGSRVGTYKNIRNIFIIFIVSGFWHGANWTFIVWGGLNAIYFIPLLIFKKNRKHIDIVAKNKNCPSLKEFLLMVSTFSLTMFTWILFRAENILHAKNYFSGIFTPSLFTIPDFEDLKRASIILLLVVIFIGIEWKGRAQLYALEKFGLNWRKPIRYGMYYVMILLIILFNIGEQEFIYFQF